VINALWIVLFSIARFKCDSFGWATYEYVQYMCYAAVSSCKPAKRQHLSRQRHMLVLLAKLAD